MSNLIDEEKEPARQRKGTFDDPLASLQDAFIRARDIAGPYQHEKLTHIHLFKGDHYILENRFDALNIYYQKESIDNFALNINLHIKPLSCGLSLMGFRRINPGDPETVGALNPAICVKKLDETVRVFNKIRERFFFPVTNMMTLERVVVDAADSILPYGTPCLSKRTQCCVIENDESNTGVKVRDFSTTSNLDCEGHFRRLKLHDTCQMAHKRPLFGLLTNDDMDDYGLVNNRLKIVNSTI